MRERHPTEKPDCDIYAVKGEIVWEHPLPWEVGHADPAELAQLAREAPFEHRSIAATQEGIEGVLTGRVELRQNARSGSMTITGENGVACEGQYWVTGADFSGRWESDCGGGLTAQGRGRRGQDARLRGVRRCRRLLGVRTPGRRTAEGDDPRLRRPLHRLVTERRCDVGMAQQSVDGVEIERAHDGVGGEGAPAVVDAHAVESGEVAQLVPAQNEIGHRPALATRRVDHKHGVSRRRMRHSVPDRHPDSSLMSPRCHS